jgi:hypothetical protein
MNKSLVASPVSPRVSADPDGCRHAERGHPVEHVAGRWCTCRKTGDLVPVLSRYAMTRWRRTDFGRPAASIRFLLHGETACAQPRPDQRLVAAHRRFDERALAIAGGGLPGKSPSLRDHFQLVITLCRLIPFAAGRRRRARWNHPVDVIAVAAIVW